MIKLIIFDLDNTLTDFIGMKEDSIDAAVTAMIDAGLDFSAEKIRSEIFRIYDEEGIEYQKVFNRLLVDLVGAVDYRIMAAGIVSYRKAREAALVLYPHVNRTLLALIKKGLKLAVISDAPRQEAWMRLCYLQLQHLFDTVVAFEDSGEHKPSPVPFRMVLDQLGMKPEEALMVGDWPERDIAGASELGIRTVFARYGDTFGTKVSGADYDIDDIFELVGIVDGINGAESKGN
ncbi:MAG: HAD-IA family hydrolase [Candidatus Krumholzibacteria bacterium]|jgi:putative hydrolase of the HAD superfamily|nr:HAD-IA family hydrolase [Candidatus Krumholzibacteria bacterium]